MPPKKRAAMEPLISDEEEKGQIDEVVDSSKPSLYDVMKIQPTATKAEIRKSYLKLSVLLHPDRNQDDEQANDKFNDLKKAYDILHDEKKRERYDKYGDDEGIDADDLYQWTVSRVDKQSIKDFQKNYKSSEEEQRDLIKFYLEKDGNISLILQSIILSENSDVARFVKFYEEKIKDGTLKETQLFKKTKSKIEMLADEKAEAKVEKKKMKKKKEDDFESLALAIRSKKDNPFLSIAAKLEAKYGGAEEANLGKKRVAKDVSTDEGRRKRKMK